MNDLLRFHATFIIVAVICCAACGLVELTHRLVCGSED